MTDPKFPAPEPGDPEDVVSALDTARVLFASGETQEAVRWIRKAADAAEQGGNDMRALTLARAAADLSSAAPAPSPAAAPPSQAPPALAGRSLPPPLRHSQSPGGTTPARPTQPPRSAAPRPATSVAAAAPSQRRPQVADASKAEAVEIELEPERETPAGAAPAATAPTATSTGGASLRAPRTVTFAAPPAPAEDVASAPEKPKRSTTSKDAAKKREASSPTAAKAPLGAQKSAKTAKSSNGGADLSNALRVSIKPSSRDDRLFMMRMLKPGEASPPGYRPALVVMVDEDEDK